MNYDALTSDNYLLQLTVAVGAARTLATPSNLAAGMRWAVRVQQPAFGGPCALAFSADYKFPYGAVPALSTAPDAVDTISCYYDGTSILAQMVNSYGMVSGIAVTGDTLVISGGVRLPDVLVVGGVVLNETHYTVAVDASAGPATVVLPDTAQAAARGRVYNVKKVDATANAVIIQRSGADLIDGATSVSITTQYQTRTVQSRSAGGAWDVI